MPRVIINVPTNTYGSQLVRFILPPMDDDDANEVLGILSRAHLTTKQRVGVDGFNVVDGVAQISTEIAPDESVLTPKQHAELVADEKQRRADDQAKEASKARAMAALMPA